MEEIETQIRAQLLAAPEPKEKEPSAAVESLADDAAGDDELL
jgi:hypothetical protein